jgi:parallel beta-helix repeat protein
MSGAGSLNVDHCSIIDNGTKGIWLSSATGTVSVTDSTVSNNTMNGFLIQESPAAMTISGNSILNNTGSGISVSNSSPSISGNTISGNSTYGIHVTGLSIPGTVAGNHLDGNTQGPLAMEANSSGMAVAGDNTFGGPLTVTAGVISRNITWGSNRVYYIPSYVIVSSGSTLTVPAGRVVKLTGYIYVNGGTLTAPGTEESPIHFTSIHDDSVGGDSNGNDNGTTPAPGNWVSIVMTSGGSATLSHCTIRYAGAYMDGSAVWSGMGGIYMDGSGSLSVANCTVTDTSTKGLWIAGAAGTVSVSNSTIRNNAVNGILIQDSTAAMTFSGNNIQNNTGSGIAASNSSPVINGNLISANSSHGISLSGSPTTPQIINNRIYGNPTGILCDASANPVIGASAEHGNEIYGNSSYGVRNTTSSIMVDATHNWWGSATGPAPAGSGNAVSEFVNFEPFLTSSFHTHNLAINFVGTGGGTVKIAPSLGSGNSAWTTPVSVGEAVTLTAHPAVDAIFAGWSGGTCGGTGTCTLTMNEDVTITATFNGMAPVADFNGTPLSGVEPLIVSLTDTTTFAPYSWNWNFGDGGASSVQHPGHDFVDAGSYAVSLTATNAHGSGTETKTGYITVSACPNGPASILPTFYDTLQLAYDASGSGAIIKGRYKNLGSLNLNKNEAPNVILKGGYDCPHETVVGITTLTGVLTITTGSAVVENIAIK